VVTRPSEEKPALAWQEIDTLHRELFGRIDEIKHTIEAQEIEALVPLLKKFGHEAKTHFRYEEGVMTRHQYPFYEDHKAQHDKLIAALEEAQSQPPSAGTLKLFLEVTRHLTEELQHCVADDDHLRGFLTEA
jgi:hemerythrin